MHVIGLKKRSQSNPISLCKVLQNKKKKVIPFTHFGQKNTHNNGCKIMHLCIIATVIMHICTVIIALAFNIFMIFSLSSLSLWLLSLSPHSHCRQSSENATPCINREHHLKIFLPKSSNTKNQYYIGFVWLPRKTQRKQEKK